MRKWSIETHKRSKKDHAHKKLVRKQKQHLKSIKSDKGLRLITLGSRHIKVGSEK